MKIRHAAALIASILLVAGCDSGLKSGRRLHLPKGNAENGQAAFVALKCNTCHTVDGVELPKPADPAKSMIVLGGEVGRLRTVGDLMTSIIHPGDSISEKMKRPPGDVTVKSPMPVVNDTMTVTQMVDLVIFLQPHYKQIQPLYDWTTSM